MQVGELAELKAEECRLCWPTHPLAVRVCPSTLPCSVATRSTRRLLSLDFRVEVIVKVAGAVKRVAKQPVAPVPVKVEAKVRRNLAKFPVDFMCQLAAEEWEALRSQFATIDAAPGGRDPHRKYLPYVFTKHGAIMAASLLSGPRAIDVLVYVVRAFMRMRELAATHVDLTKRLAELEEKTDALAASHDTFSRNTRNQLKQVFDALRELMTPPEPPKRPIGFVTADDKSKKAKG